MLISQVEIYDQIWCARNVSTVKGEHSAKSIELIKEFVARLEKIPDSCAESFPFELIDELKEEFFCN
jgi:hypothetical protein